jgi:hypothetical protein
LSDLILNSDLFPPDEVKIFFIYNSMKEPSAGGEASHHERGLQAADEKTKENSERRLQYCSRA